MKNNNIIHTTMRAVLASALSATLIFGAGCSSYDLAPETSEEAADFAGHVVSGRLVQEGTNYLQYEGYDENGQLHVDLTLYADRDGTIEYFIDMVDLKTASGAPYGELQFRLEPAEFVHDDATHYGLKLTNVNIENILLQL